MSSAKKQTSEMNNRPGCGVRRLWLQSKCAGTQAPEMGGVGDLMQVF